jgi:hypothetical protein
MLPAVTIDQGSDSLSWLEVSNDDSVPANARVWDFAMPPKSCSTLPLLSDSLVCEYFNLKPARRISPRIAGMKECGGMNP